MAKNIEYPPLSDIEYPPLSDRIPINKEDRKKTIVEEQTSKLQSYLAALDSKSFCTSVYAYDSVSVALNIASINGVFRHRFQNKDRKYALDVYNECESSLIAFRFLYTVLHFPESFRLKTSRYIFKSGLSLFYDKNSGTLEIKSQFDPSLQETLGMIGTLFMINVEALKSLCSQAKFNEYLQKLVGTAVAGGHSLLVEFLDGRAIMDYNIKIKCARTESEKRQYYQELSAIYDNYIGRDDEMGRNAILFRKEYERFELDAAYWRINK